MGKIARPLTRDQGRDRLRALAMWTTHTPNAADVIAATEISDKHKLSFWDAMIIQSAHVLRCPTLWTEDLQHGQTIRGVAITNPFA